MPKTKPFDLYAKEYDNWFVINKLAFRSELEAIKKALPSTGNIIEIGIGSGMFAGPLGIKEGIEPSKSMLKKAKAKGLHPLEGTAESLPYANKSKDAALMVTTICFLDDIYKSFHEIHRILKTGGHLVIGFVDKDSPVGKLYLQHKDKSIFYKNATFFGTDELKAILKNTRFEIVEVYQTIFGKIDEIKNIQEVEAGHGKGSFIVIKAQKV